MFLLAALAFLVSINLVTIGAFAHDKAAAIEGRRRTREADLLMLALMGGSIGAFWARHHFRHKTRKQPFSSRLAWIAAVQAGIVVGISAAFV